MGLLTIIKKQKRKDNELRVLFLGLDNAGKSTLVNALLPTNERVESITPTVGFKIHSLSHNGKLLSIWDVGGQRTLRPFWENYFGRTDIVVWCVDSAANTRAQESLEEWTKLVRRDQGLIGRDMRVIVVLTKNDLLKGPERDITLETMKQGWTSDGVDVDVVTCSAMTRIGLDEFLDELSR